MDRSGSPGSVSPRRHQRTLPLAAPMLGSPPPPFPIATVRTRQVWASLGLTGQAQRQAVLLRIVREVLRERAA